jgi:general secretion pathway protein H
MPRTLAIGSQQGFTLLELMVVMAILVMVAALFPVALDRALPGRRVAATTERLISLVHEAQMASVLSGRPVSLTLRPHALTAILADKAPSVAFPASMTVRMLDAQGRDIPQLLLYPDSSSRGARLQIEDSGRRGALVVSAITGRIFSPGSP